MSEENVEAVRAIYEAIQLRTTFVASVRICST